MSPRPYRPNPHIRVIVGDSGYPGGPGFSAEVPTIDWATVIRMAIPGDTVTVNSNVHVVRPRCSLTWGSFFCLSCCVDVLTLEALEEHLTLEGGHVIAGRCELHGLECRGSSK